MRLGAPWLAALGVAMGALAAAPSHPANPWSATDIPSGRPVRVVSGAALHHVVFFATWCPPCVDELPALTELEARFSESGYELVIVAVSARQSDERLAWFWSEHDVPGRLLFDADGSVERALAVESIPVHLLLDSSGVEVLRAETVRDGLRQAIHERLEASD